MQKRTSKSSSDMIDIDAVISNDSSSTADAAKTSTKKSLESIKNNIHDIQKPSTPETTTTTTGSYQPPNSALKTHLVTIFLVLFVNNTKMNVTRSNGYHSWCRCNLQL
mmetsp:Transcript_31961/g.37255  ORF Transcript_31961/g.37255 Transcript_31961/m.37255 type:complete len:108 (-) Transcript_31961:85-408(-)